MPLLERWNWGHTPDLPSLASPFQASIFHINDLYQCDLMHLSKLCRHHRMGSRKSAFNRAPHLLRTALLLCIPRVALLVRKPTKWLSLFFVPKHLVMLIVVYQTNTGHRASSLYNESNAQNKFTFKCWSCHAFNVVHQLSSFFRTLLCNFRCTPAFEFFAHFALQFSPMKLYFWCLANIFLKSLTNIFCLLPSFFTWNILKHLRYLCCKRYTLLDIGLNLWHSLVLQSQISDFRYSLTKSVFCVKLFSLNNFIHSLNDAPKAHYFCFLLLIQRSAVQEKSNKATLPNTKCFFYCKTHVVRTIAMFIASQ